MHPLRFDLHNELHARPSLYFDEPANIFHATLIGDNSTLTCLLSDLGVQEPLPVGHFPCQGILKICDYLAKWERHTEFLTITLVAANHSKQDIWQDIPYAMAKLIKKHHESVIECTQVRVEPKESWINDPGFYGFIDPSASNIGGGDAMVWSDFRLTADGVNRILLVNSGLNSFRLGRMTRRLLEIETYRMVASLSLPRARKLAPILKEFEIRLATLSEANSRSKQKNTRELLEKITELSSNIAHETANIRNRFSATEAYAQIVHDRISELRESHVHGRQRLGVMIERRFKPTVRYCSATHRRLEEIGDSVAHLTGLLQTRVHVEVEDQNSSILESLNSRATTQIKIQQAVEGLSIIAISYYIISLLKMLYEAANGVGFAVSSRDATLYAAPIAIIAIIAVAHHIVKIRRD